MLTRFEIARIIGARALQISMGAPILIKSTKGSTTYDIAKEEYDERVLPLAVIRKMPNNQEVVVNINGDIIGQAS